MAITNMKYDTANRHTFTITSINTLGDGEFASTDIFDNTTFLAMDAAIYGEFTFGASGPIDGETINIYLTPIFSDGVEDFFNADLDSAMQTDAGNSLIVDDTDFILENLILAKVISMNATASKVYGFVIPSVAQILGMMPEKLQCIVENTAATAADNFAASGNEMHLTPAEFESA